MAFSMQAAQKFQELMELEGLFFQLTEEDRLSGLAELFATIREDPRGANRAVQHLHDDFHERKPQRQEGATVVTLLLPFSVEEAGLSAPDKLGRYSEAMVELGLRGSDPTVQQLAARLCCVVLALHTTLGKRQGHREA